MFKIGWNDGHTLTGVGTGAVGIIKETDRNRAIGARAREILLNEYEGIEIINCTIDKSNNDMAEAVKIANDNKCDLFISNHVNAGGGTGFEGFYSRMASSSDISKGKIIYDRLVKTKSCLAARRFCSDYSYKQYDFYVLRNTSMPAFLYEIGFVDNQTCVNAVNNEEVSRAYAEGIAAAYSLKKKAIVPSNPTPEAPNLNLYTAKITVDVLNVRKGPGTNYAVATTVKKGEVYTIVEESNGWGKLKSGAGWISLEYTSRNGTTTSPKPTIIGSGSKVKIVGSKYATGQNIPSWVKNNTYTVQQVSGEKSLIKEITSWVYTKDLILV